MPDFPLQGIEIEDFRRLSGYRSYALDAPIVLIHGPNGSGKTSILSALELGLTGQITGLDDSDSDQFQHLPHVDANGATVRVGVAPTFAQQPDRERMNVSRTRGVSGPPALGPMEARFYRERCYLDQPSLGRLLEIYQDTDSAKESVLTRFVNELLGLGPLDALRDGLADATHVTKLRKRAQHLGIADQRKKDAALRRTERTRALADAKAALAKARQGVSSALAVLGYTDNIDGSTEALLDIARHESNADDVHAAKRSVSTAHGELLGLGGQLNAIRQMPGGQDLTSLDAAAGAAEAALAGWSSENLNRIESWDRDASAEGLLIQGQDRGAAVRTALRAAQQTLETQSTLRDRLEAAEESHRVAQQTVDSAQAAYDDAREHASRLVEGLVALRPYIDGNTCPVCDRDYGDIGGDLGEHVDHRVLELTEHSERLVQLRDQRDAATTELKRRGADTNQIRGGILSTDEHARAVYRASALQKLADRLTSLQPTINHGAELISRAEASRRAYRDMAYSDALSKEVGGRLQRLAESLNLTLPSNYTLREQQRYLTGIASQRVESTDAAIQARTNLTTASADLAEAVVREAKASRLVSDANQEEGYWEERIKEGTQRHKIAKELHDAADKARSSIIQRVFTSELNSLWRDLFTRLAPMETYVPAFGAVADSKSVKPRLVTLHKNGDTSGSPRLMLSTGNLNTAAVSLFLALHLSIKNAVPCLVFDDPVQAMDEVHVAQFAALIRTLSKDLNRQVVIAVHERELFDYLSLELSPAFPGDELITIRLGDDAPKDGWHRESYRPDTTIAV